MSRALVLCVVASGCFYVDPINQRPSLDIRQSSGDVVYRTDEVKLDAVANDPEGHFVHFQWRAYLCTAQGDCDQAPFYTEILDHADFVVPKLRDDNGEPVQAVQVYLEGTDDYGATARPEQQLLIPVADHPPVLDLRKDSRYRYVVDTPINVYALASDPDDGLTNLAVTWKVYSPTSNPGFELVDLAVTPPDASHVEAGKEFKPHGIGEWTIEVTATDQLGTPTTQTLMINVQPDTPPCLTQLSPIIAPTGSAFPMSEPTFFEVTIVTDDLDPYPTFPDPVLRTTTFSWSLQAPGSSTHVALPGISGNRVALDPAAYAPGDILELRVEIYDRNAIPIPCADSSATCSVTVDQTCLQRQTWRVEVR